MTPTIRTLAFAAFGLVASSSVADAGWNTVAHLTCCDGPIRRAFRTTTVAPQRQETRYESRSYYETITVMKPETIQEPYDVNVRSYYFEPVTSYSRRSYYDPCSGQCQQIDVPRTSYVRREECRTETRYLEKTRMVPVQMEREITETRPVYTYYGSPTRTIGPMSNSAPQMQEHRNSPKIEVDRQPSNGEGYTPIPNPGNMSRSPRYEMRKPVAPSTAPASTPATSSKFNAMSTSLGKASGATVLGEVTAADRTTPASEAKIVFVNVADLKDRRYITTDTYGSYETTLPSGEWHVYGGPGNGKAELLGKLSTKDGQRLEPIVALK